MANHPLDVRNLCEIREDVYTLTRGDQVVHLSSLVEANANKAKEFFEKNHITSGMRELLRGALKKLSGEGGQSILELKQSMGGGKTHSMIALGMIATNPEMASYLPDDITEGFSLKKAKIAAINGRAVDDKGQIIGDIAKQLGKEMQWQYKWSNGISNIEPMSEKDWMDMIGHDSVLIMMDELPPYFAQAITRRVGEGTLLDVMIYSISNLFSAAMKLPNTVVVISSLDAAYEDASRAISGKVNDLKKEAARGAKTITPVDLNSDEIYSILKKQLFAKLPSEEQIKEVQESYRKALKESIASGALSKTSEMLADEIVASYPFHPSYKDILSMFKDNDKFRQTRGLIEFSANLLGSIFSDNDETREYLLAGVQHLDFADLKTRDQMKDIERSLESAMMKDVYDNDGSAHAQQLDAINGNKLSSMIAKMLFVSSLSDNAEGIKGLSEGSLQEYIVAPGINALDVQDGLRALKSQCWYLHTRDGEKWFFSDSANLKKRLDEKVKNANLDHVNASLKKYIQDAFQAQSKIAYDQVIALPKEEDVHLSYGSRLCLILPPCSSNPPEVAKRIFSHQIYKNAFCVISCEHSKMATLEDLVRRLWAIDSIMIGQDGNHRIKLELSVEREDALMKLNSAMSNTFNRIYFPASQRGEDVMRHTSLDLSLTDAKNKLMGEQAVINALSGSSAMKLMTFKDAKGNDLAGDARGHEIEKLIARAEDMLFPQQTSRLKWGDLRTKASVSCGWPWLPPKVFDEVKNTAVGKGRWSHDSDDYVDCKPKPPEPSVSIMTTNENLDNGTFDIQVTGVNTSSSAQIFMSCEPDPVRTGSVITDYSIKTDEVELWFAVVDPVFEGEPEAKRWRGSLGIRHEVQEIGDIHAVSLICSSEGADLFWSTNGVFSVDAHKFDPNHKIEFNASEDVKLYVLAKKGGIEERRTLMIKGKDTQGPAYDPTRPIMMEHPVRGTTRQEVFSILDSAAAEDKEIRIYGLKFDIGDGSEAISFRAGSGVFVNGKQARTMLENMKVVMDHDNKAIQISASKIRFDNQRVLQSFAATSGVSISADHLTQSAD